MQMLEVPKPSNNLRDNSNSIILLHIVGIQ
jgi:hypothetical protein